MSSVDTKSAGSLAPSEIIFSNNEIIATHNCILHGAVNTFEEWQPSCMIMSWSILVPAFSSEYEVICDRRQLNLWLKRIG